MSNLYVVMPAYNEAENIESVVREWYPVLKLAGPDSRLVIADGGSKDVTHEILLSLKEEFPLLETLDTKRPEHGPKLVALYNYAIDNGADLVFQTDSDGQTTPSEFPDFLEAIKDNDAVIGFRKVRGDGASRAFVEKIVCLLLRVIFGVNVPDANAPFRLMKTELLKKYMGRFADDYNLPNIMLTTFFAHYKEKVAFKEITFKPRTKGTSSLNVKKITLIGLKALKDFKAFKKGL